MIYYVYTNDDICYRNILQQYNSIDFIQYFMMCISRKTYIWLAPCSMQYSVFIFSLSSSATLISTIAAVPKRARPSSRVRRGGASSLANSAQKESIRERLPRCQKAIIRWVSISISKWRWAPPPPPLVACKTPSEVNWMLFKKIIPPRNIRAGSSVQCVRESACAYDWNRHSGGDRRMDRSAGRQKKSRKRPT